MSKKKIIAIVVCVLLAIMSNILIYKHVDLGTVEENQPIFGMEFCSSASDVYQISYTNIGDNFNEQDSDFYVYSTAGEQDKANFDMNLTKNALRIDFGGQPGTIEVYDMWYEVMFDKQTLDLELFKTAIYVNDIDAIDVEGGVAKIHAFGYDPYVIIHSQAPEFYETVGDQLQAKSRVVSIILCIIIDLFVLVGIIKINYFAALVRELYRERKLIFSLAKNDFKTRFAGSYLGIVWAFVQPIVTVLVYWFVFQVGMKSGNVSDYPFILWLMAGLVPWFFFSEALNGGTGVFMEYNYLVKKVVFKISILPVVKMFSAVIVHLFFVAFVIVMCWAYGFTPDLYLLQIVYYIFCAFVFTLGLVYVTSSIVVFFRDLVQIIGILLQVGIWVTPIMWDATNMLAPKYVNLLKINPFYYVVDGFRDALLGKEWFWDKEIWTIYFWLVSIAIFGVGVALFKKLKVHFADVL